MKSFNLASCILLLLALIQPALAATSTKEVMIDKQKGFLTCSGGTQAPLFKQDCKLLTVERVSFGGTISYEARCKDSSGTEFIVACIAFSYEPDLSLSVPTTDFLQ
ncbi:MAG: hypothetical protein KDD46_07455 [Bdellovibrionales bacterium]|nr:hypothetical protein [Bdellovibrionales bacterium]